MEYRNVEITLQHAEDLYKAAYLCKMAVYGVVSLSNNHDGSRHKFKSPVDRDGDTRPTWNFPTKFQVSEAAVSADSLTLHFHLFCLRYFFGDSPLGHVDVSIKHLLHSAAATAAAADGWRCTCLPVTLPDGTTQGQLNFSYKFSQIINPAAPLPPPLQPVSATDWTEIFKVAADATVGITQVIVGAITAKDTKVPNPKPMKVETTSTSAGIRMSDIGVQFQAAKEVQDYLIKNTSSLHNMRNIKHR